MDKKSFLLCFLLLILPLFFKAQDDSRIVQSRIHGVIFLDEATSIEHTWIQNYVNLNSKMKLSALYVLSDLGKEGKWVYTLKVENPDSADEKRTEVFENRDTNELLKITYSLSNGKTDKYLLEAEPKKTTYFVNAEKIPNDPDGFCSFVIDNFSTNFLTGLKKLKDLVFTIFNKNIYFPITPKSFRPIWGMTKETETVGFISPSSLLYPVNLYYNCDFDAKFGFPCTKDEVPAKNPKVLVIEKK